MSFSIWSIPEVIMKVIHISILLVGALAAPYLTNAEDKLKVGVYYESLCPYSMDFIGTQLVKAHKSLGKYFTVYFNPYGNAKVKKS